MEIPGIAYLSRYVFLLLLGWAGIRLLKHAMLQIRARLRLREAPLSGYFLQYIPPREGLPSLSWPALARSTWIRGQQQVRLPLHPTTVIGQGRECDLQLAFAGWEKRCATLYRDAGNWWLRPLGKVPVFFNEQQVTAPVLLHSRDQIRIGAQRFVFVDERAESAAIGARYNELQADYESGHYAALTQAAPSPQERLRLAEVLSRRGPWFPWFLCNVFAVLSLAMQYLLFPVPDGGLLQSLAYWQIAIPLVLNLYFFLLPATVVNLDRASYLTFAFLVLWGNLVQFRLALVNRSQITEAKVQGDWERYESLLQYVYHDFLTQDQALLLGLILLPIVCWLFAHTRLAERTVFLCIALTPALYLCTLALGKDPGGVHGARLWLQIGSFSLQLSEFAKISYLVVLAGFFKIRPQGRMQLLFAAWAAGNFFLIMLLPDLGSILILLPTTWVVYVVMTSEYCKGGLLLVGGSAAGVLAYMLFPHVRRRLEGWQTLWSEVNPGNEQIVHGLRAVARGGLLGRGIGNGSPAGIPEASGDMVFSVLIEEWGILAGLILILFFLVLWLRSAYVAAEAEDGFASALILGCATLLFLEALVVIGGSTGLIPLTGATLPFVAKGGSSLLAKTILVGALLGVAGRKNRYNSAQLSLAPAEEDQG